MADLPPLQKGTEAATIAPKGRTGEDQSVAVDVVMETREGNDVTTEEEVEISTETMQEREEEAVEVQKGKE